MSRYEIPTPAPMPFPWRPMMYGLVIAALLLDMMVFRGPVRRWIDRQISGEPIHERAARFHYASTVNSLPIPCEEVERVAAEHLARSGRSLADLDPTARRMVMVAALERLRRSRMVTFASYYGGMEIDPDAVAGRKRAMAGTFQEGEEELTRRIKHIGFEDPALFDRELQKLGFEEAWVEREIAPALEVSDRAVRLWYEANRESLQIPERVRVRHLFLTKAGEPGQEPPDPAPKIAELHQLLEQGGNFAGLVREHSQDPRSQKAEGDLGWISRCRVPADFAEAVFAQEPGETGRPFETELGWHIAIVEAKEPARLPALEEVAPEIRAMLVSERRAYAIGELIRQLEEKTTVLDFPEVFDAYLAEMDSRLGVPGE